MKICERRDRAEGIRLHAGLIYNFLISFKGIFQLRNSSLTEPFCNITRGAAKYDYIKRSYVYFVPRPAILNASLRASE